MTKERKLAIQMWKEIRKEILLFHKNAHVESLKTQFLNSHNVNWASQCWFRHYLRLNHFPSERGCTLCPIAISSARVHREILGCDANSLWHQVIYSSFRLVRVIACTRIIWALKRRY